MSNGTPTSRIKWLKEAVFGRALDPTSRSAFHSIALAALVGIMVSLQAYVFPFTRLVTR